MRPTYRTLPSLALLVHISTTSIHSNRSKLEKQYQKKKGIQAQNQPLRSCALIQDQTQDHVFDNLGLDNTHSHTLQVEMIRSTFNPHPHKSSFQQHPSD